MLFPPPMFVRVRAHFTLYMRTDYLMELLSSLWSFRIQKLKYNFNICIIYEAFLCNCMVDMYPLYTVLWWVLCVWFVCPCMYTHLSSPEHFITKVYMETKCIEVEYQVVENDKSKIDFDLRGCVSLSFTWYTIPCFILCHVSRSSLPPCSPPPPMFVRAQTKYAIHMQTDDLIELRSSLWSFRIQKLKYNFNIGIIYVSFLCICMVEMYALRWSTGLLKMTKTK